MINEIIRLRGMGLSRRKIALALSISRNTVDKYLAGANDGAPVTEGYRAPWSDGVDWTAAHAATLKGEPLAEFWESHASGLAPYVSFWREFRRRFPNIPLDYHKIHPPGERVEIDYKGDAAGLGYVDRASREFIPCRLFGAVMAFSQLFFPRATLTEKQPDVLRSIAEAYGYFGGVPLTSAVDNAKALVAAAHRYDPDINREFSHFCAHFGTAPLAMRPKSPKDKNVIENALGVFWRWARRRVRGRTFFSLGELNAFLKALADEFNDRVQRKYGVSRRQKFAAERDKILPLPDAAYAFGEWKTALLHPDCHLQIGKNFYSAPYQLRGKSLEVRLTQSIVEIYHKLECVARHLKAHPNSTGQYFSKDEHLPEAHRAMREATPQRAIDDAAAIGPNVEAIIRSLIEEARHPLMYLRRSQGILRLSKRYSARELDAACATLVAIGTKMPRLVDVESIIKTNLAPKSAKIIPIQRRPNPFLRGQDAWRDPLTIEEKS